MYLYIFFNKMLKLMFLFIYYLNLHSLKLNSNIKRINTCKSIGLLKKTNGHKLELEFKKKYNIINFNNTIQYKSTSDTHIDILDPINYNISNTLNLNYNKIKYCSNKSGNNIQFTLGNIPELNINNNINWLSNKNNCLLILNKYLKKNNSLYPSDILVYKNDINNKWLFFNMDDIINYIIDNVIWRKLNTGRIKGDIKDNSKKGYSQYITYEHKKNNSYFFGINCNKGKNFINLLINNIVYFEDNI